MEDKLLSWSSKTGQTFWDPVIILQHHVDKEYPNDAIKITLKDSTTLRLNERHLFSLIKVDDLPEMPKDVEGNVDDIEGLKYIVETHFTNQDANFMDF